MSPSQSLQVLGAFVALCLPFGSQCVLAAGMVPETPVVVVDQATGEATLNVRNTDDHPSLLYSVIEHIAEDDEPLLILSPPVARVEPGQSQQVRFILNSATPLKTERLKRVVFEGIAPRQDAEGARVTLGLRQNIPVILRPANLAVERTPWKLLNWVVTGKQLQVSNPSPYVVRLAKSVNLIPGGATVDLGRTYILPGEVLMLAASSTFGTHVQLFPATTYGFTVGSYDAPLSTQ
ncbi:MULTISPECIES: fimbria/pilus chaperone family protein [unclassified Pseudomonas]|uniref:fimbria/pilus chaperone family protein n=1 Tax=unclassified Pseudomonas TaxID=196821 RepID=UPI002AC9083C|nr:MULTISPECIES: fimbria/pilus chaperone family protein [unclassified Pseudomonas]MEB0043839.1 fimbria/pilus chaperone family protein [Pseudomonas sp. Dout3]MEB0095223.1 fimbria/pilus chaperone family protein [Pseudomonas sp. DC1.2]WPX58780.1 fimbria/pilus chaperone family protein [Pseudomonas sp. DC1.2]